MRLQPLRLLLQVINYAVFMAIVWYFATSPTIEIRSADEAVLTIAFAHAGALREPCRRLSQEELNQLPANMRRLEECPRERSPVTIEARLDGDSVFRETLDPPGLFDDGGVDIYFSAKIPAGSHRLVLGMNDSIHIEGFNHRLDREIRLSPGRVLLVDFDRGSGFILTGLE